MPAPLLDASRSPRRRPPIVLRGLIGLIGLAVVLLTGALMLSDRAPRVLRAVFGDRARRLWKRVENAGRTDVITGGTRPDIDFLVHVAIWAVVACLIGLAIWSWFGLLATAIGVFGLSVVTELAQGVWSSTRTVEVIDVMANAVGVAIGVTASAVSYVLWSGVAGTVAAWRNRF